MKMKKFLMMFFVAVLPLAFVACSDDDDENEDTPITLADLVGEWQIQKANSMDIAALGADVTVSFNSDNSFGVAASFAGTELINDNSGKYTMDEAAAKVVCEFMGLELDINLDSLVGDLLTISTVLPDETSIPMFNGAMTMVCKKK